MFPIFADLEPDSSLQDSETKTFMMSSYPNPQPQPSNSLFCTITGSGGAAAKMPTPVNTVQPLENQESKQTKQIRKHILRM